MGWYRGVPTLDGGYLPWPMATLDGGTSFGWGGTYLGWGGTYPGQGAPTLDGGCTYRGWGVPTLTSGPPTLDGGTYLGWVVPTLSREVPTLGGGGAYPGWGYLPWTGVVVPTKGWEGTRVGGVSGREQGERVQGQEGARASLTTMESLDNGVATHFGATPLWSMRAMSQTSSCSVDAN